MALGKKNVVSFDFGNYTYVIIGEPKIGKTTLINDVCKQLTSRDDSLLSINLGNEHGYQLIEGLVYEEAKTWSEFVALVKELVTKPEENSFKFISIETIDQLVTLAEAEVCRLSDLESKTGKKSTINSAFGGFGRGQEKVKQLIFEQVNSLIAAKYGIFFVGHTAVKTIKDYEGIGAKQVTNSLDSRYYDLFANLASVIAVLTVENDYTNLSADDQGRIMGKIKDSQRWIYFRSTELITAGTRLAHIPNRVPLTATNFIEAVKEGLSKEAKFDGDSNEFEKRAELDAKKRETNATLFAESELRKDYFDKFKDKYAYTSAEVQQSVKDFVKANGYESISDMISKANLSIVEELVALLPED